MARSAGTTIENNFVKGRISEATGLNFPENAVVDELNCVFERTGKVTRRKGFDLETGATYNFVSSVEVAYTEYVWNGAAGIGDYTLIVTQVGSLLFFYKLTNAIAISPYKLVGSIPLYPYGSQATIEINHCQFKDGFGYLFVANPGMTNIYITYDGVAAVTVTPYSILTRDTKGLDYPLFGRETTSNANSLYQLVNQGWTLPLIDEFFTAVSSYPNAYDVWWLMKDQNEVFDPTNYANKILRGNSPAPRGSIILDEFNQDRTGQTGIGYIAPITSDGAKPSTVEVYAGRLWYSGVRHRNYSNKIYFTKVIERTDDYGRCYQMNDPTSEYASDLLPSDGGVIAIPDCGQIHKLWSIENALLVFASNGIWQIQGSNGIGFAANDYAVKKISSLAISSGVTFTDVAGFPAWWQEDNIYVVSVNSQIGSTSVQALTENISTFYEDIPSSSKQYAKGAYDPIEKRIQWLYRDTEFTTVASRYHYNKVLVFDVQTKAFYTWEVDNSIITPAGIIYTNLTGIKYLLKHRTDYTVTFGNLHETEYRDWASSASPVSYDSYFITGYKVHGDANKKFQANYLNLYNETIPEYLGSYDFQSVWDYAVDNVTGKYTQTQRITFDDSQYAYKTKRLKIRGNGKALQFKVNSVGNEPFSIIGWSGWETANSNV